MKKYRLASFVTFVIELFTDFGDRLGVYTPPLIIAGTVLFGSGLAFVVGAMSLSTGLVVLAFSVVGVVVWIAVAMGFVALGQWSQAYVKEIREER